jgi:hypothetical protein
MEVFIEVRAIYPLSFLDLVDVSAHLLPWKACPTDKITRREANNPEFILD